MTPTGFLLVLSPLVPMLISFAFRAPAARRLARWLPLTWLVLMLPLIWFARDCAGEALTYVDCRQTPQSVADVVGTAGFMALLIWIAAGPLILIAALMQEWRFRRGG